MVFKVHDIPSLRQFEFERLLNEGAIFHLHLFALPDPPPLDPITHSYILLGTFPKDEGSSERLPAILRVEKTVLSAEKANKICSDHLIDVSRAQENDIASPLLSQPPSKSHLLQIAVCRAFRPLLSFCGLRCEDKCHIASHEDTHSEGMRVCVLT